MNSEATGLEVAIIGISGRFPGSPNLKKFWENLIDGVEFVTILSTENQENQASNQTRQRVKAAALLEDIEQFDASFFGINPREAEILDPQHRLFLECAWEALEDAGYDSEIEERPIGIYAGVGRSTYLLYNLLPNHLDQTLGYFPTLLASDKDYVPTRVSYKLNLKGPSVSVGTACSSSLVAVHLAYQSLLSGDCDIALAAGVSVKAPQNEATLCPEEISPDGRCFAFDARANGTIGGNGLGVVVLKRLEDAIAERDHIYAVIKGSAINNDGALKVSYTAPSEDAQTKVIRAAQLMAEVEPETITYIETHGTGTALGDPIEIAGLKQAFSSHQKATCAIGSVKTNIGHLDAAAGIASLIKTVLSLKYQLLPPSLNFETPNPQIDFENSPFYVNTQLSEWKTKDTPRRAGVSSFGFGGTNAHVILEEAPQIESSTASRPWQLLILSAKTPSALETATLNLIEHLKQHPDLNLADVAYTLQIGRRAFEYRRAVIFRTVEDATNALQDPKRVLTSLPSNSGKSVAFLFTGLGTHYVNMAGELYQVEPIFQSTVDRCCEFLKPLLNLDLRDVLYPQRYQSSESNQLLNAKVDLRKMLGRDDSETADEATQKLNQTCLTQPAIFVLEYALAQLWISWGIRPAAMMGYSIGEYVAACLAGVFSLEDALTLVAKRAQMIQALPQGAMLAVPLSEAEVQPFLTEKLSLSAINGSKLCVMAGSLEAIDELAQKLTEMGLVSRRLQTSHGFHSSMMTPMVPAFIEVVKTISLHAPQIPYLSNVTGTWITAEQATDPQYWATHLCQPVRFAQGVNELWKQQPSLLLEVGPGQTLGSLAQQSLEGVSLTEKVIFASLRDRYYQQSDLAFILNTLGQLWLSGIQINWSGFYAHESRYRLSLPTYPFERQRYWIDPPQAGQTSVNLLATSQRKSDPADWFYYPVWQQVMPPVSDSKLEEKTACWLLFLDEWGIGTQLAQRLETEHQKVILVETGAEFRQHCPGRYTLNPRSREDYQALFQDLKAREQLPDQIVHLWSLSALENSQSGLELFSEMQHLGFYSLLFLTQALSQLLINHALPIWVVSNGMQAVESTDCCWPEKATLLGLSKVIPQEYSDLTCHTIDITLPKPGSHLETQLIDQIFTEMRANSSELAIAYRGHQRWRQTFEPVRLNAVEKAKRLRQNGVYLITGGLGRIGLTLAQSLAQIVQAKLVLVSRSGLPPLSVWPEWLRTHEAQDLISFRIKQVQQLEALGAEVLVIAADVTNESQMQAAFEQAEAKFGRVQGVIHAAAFIGEEIVSTLEETGYSNCELQFKPKVYGLYTLEKVLRGRELEFCLLISSIGAVLGGVGFAAYSAANSVLDAFAHQQNQQGNTFWCSVNWFHSETANLLRSSLLEATQDASEVEHFRQETIDAFQRILAHPPVPQLALWRQDINAEIEKWIKHQPRPSLKEENSSEKIAYPRSNLQTLYVAPSNEIEEKIAKLYQEFLGIAPVGIHDNFFDLGGHSLLATQLIARIRKAFQLEIPLRAFLEAPTVAEFALMIEAMLIEELEALTEAEAQELMTVNPGR